MCTSFFVTVLSFIPAVGDGTAQNPPDNLAAVIERALKVSNLNRAASILWSYLSDESTIRSAFLTSEALDERTVYILFGGHWGSYSEIGVRNRPHCERILVDAITTKPMLVRLVIRG